MSIWTEWPESNDFRLASWQGLTQSCISLITSSQAEECIGMPFSGDISLRQSQQGTSCKNYWCFALSMIASKVKSRNSFWQIFTYIAHEQVQNLLDNSFHLNPLPFPPSGCWKAVTWCELRIPDWVLKWHAIRKNLCKNVSEIVTTQDVIIRMYPALAVNLRFKVVTKQRVATTCMSLAWICSHPQLPNEKENLLVGSIFNSIFRKWLKIHFWDIQTKGPNTRSAPEAGVVKGSKPHVKPVPYGESPDVGLPGSHGIHRGKFWTLSSARNILAHRDPCIWLDEHLQLAGNKAGCTRRAATTAQTGRDSRGVSVSHKQNNTFGEACFHIVWRLSQAMFLIHAHYPGQIKSRWDCDVAAPVQALLWGSLLRQEAGMMSLRLHPWLRTHRFRVEISAIHTCRPRSKTALQKFFELELT